MIRRNRPVAQTRSPEYVDSVTAMNVARRFSQGAARSLHALTEAVMPTGEIQAHNRNG